MQRRKILDRVQKHIHNNRIIYITLLLCFLIGTFAGMIRVFSLPVDETHETAKDILRFFQNIDMQEQKFAEVFFASLVENSRFLIVICLCGLNVMLAPVAFLVIATKGFAIGYTISFFISQFGFKGFLLSLIVTLPQVLLILPLLLFFSSYSIRWARSKKVNKHTTEDSKRYFNKILCGFASIGAFGIIDTFIIPVFVNNITVLFI